MGKDKPAGQDFAAGRDLCAREPKFSADILAPVAHKVRLAAKVLSGRKDLLGQSFATTPVGLLFVACEQAIVLRNRRDTMYNSGGGPIENGRKKSRVSDPDDLVVNQVEARLFAAPAQPFRDL